MNAAQSQLKKIGVKTLPQLFRFALEKIDVNLADQVLDYETRIANLNVENTSLREEIKTADKTVELHKRDSEKWERLFDEKFELYSGGMRVFQERAEEAEKLLREKIEAYEKEVAKVSDLENTVADTRLQRDEFEKLLYDQKNKYDECHEERVKYRELLREISVAVGCDGAKFESLAARASELRTARNKFHPGYIFLCHELGLDSKKSYDMDHFHNEFKVLFAILEDDQDAHLRLGLRLKNIFARCKNASRTRNEYFDLLCKRLGLNSDAPYSLHDFHIAFDRLLSFEDEDNSFEFPPETVSFWERIKRIFGRKS